MNIAEKLLTLLRRVATGEVVPRLEDPERTFDTVYCGHIGCIVDGWTLVVFNDCSEFDYIDRAVSPDGREYDCDAINSSGEHVFYGPDEMLEDEDERLFAAMEDAFFNAV